MAKINKPATLKVYGGNCCLCEVGIPTGNFDMDGKAVHTGDIVSLYHLENADEDHRELECPLTVIVADQFQNWCGGEIDVKDEPLDFYAMGIRSSGIGDDKWRVSIVKKFSDVIEGEHWPAWGFAYRMNPTADAALAARTRKLEAE